MMPHTLTGLLLLAGLGALAQDHFGDRLGPNRARGKYLTGNTVQTVQSGQGKTSNDFMWASVILTLNLIVSLISTIYFCVNTAFSP